MASSVNDLKLTSTKRYRPEIDGIRAFAVVSVIINHFNEALLPSGYLGVDIFFVISGYVITSSLAAREFKSFQDFLTGFYTRRIKRLFPALLFFVLITSLVFCLFKPDPVAELNIGWQALFGFSNIGLYQASVDYFSQSTELNPFTHTWSLGVEEQFYIVFPLLIWFTGFGRGARNLFLWIGVLSMASVISFVYLYSTNQPAAYFLMPSRFWEMAAGCLVFIGLQKRSKIVETTEKIPPLIVGATMLGVMFLPARANVLLTIAIVLLSAILLACLRKGSNAYTLLTLPKVCYFGLISYSLYLWHWGVLCLSRWTIGIHWWTAPLQICAMLLMAVGSYQWLETPCRSSRIFDHKRWIIIGGGIITALLASLALQALGKRSSRLYLGKVSVPSHLLRYADVIPVGQNCRIFDQVPSPDNVIKECGMLISKDLPTIYIVGDSHARGLGSYMDRYAVKSQKFNVATIWGNACMFTSSLNSSYRHLTHQGKDCRKLQEETITLVRKIMRKNDSLVVANASINSFLPDSGITFRTNDGSPLSKQEARDIYFNEITDIFKTVVARKGLVFFYMSPERYDPIENPMIDCKGGAEWNTQWFDKTANSSRADKCLVPKEKIVAHYRKFFDKNIKEMTNAFGSNTLIDSFSTGICDKNQCNGAFTTDGGHLQGWALAYLADLILSRTGYLL